MVRLRSLAGTYGCVCVLMLSACATRQATNATPAQPLTPADLDTQITQYVSVQEALAADGFADARSALQDLLTISDATTAPLVRSAANAEDIATMRRPASNRFQSIWRPKSFLKATHGRTVRCTTEGRTGYRLTVRSATPYYGSVMLTCGVVDAAPGRTHGPPRRGMAAPSLWRQIAFITSRARIQKRESSASTRPTTIASRST